jgi:hypothetical protein
MAVAPELETLDQLLGANRSLKTLRCLYLSDAAFLSGLLGLLQAGDIELDGAGAVAVRPWQ